MYEKRLLFRLVGFLFCMVLGQPVVVSLFSNLLSAFASVWVDQCFLGNFMYHPAATAISAGNKLVCMSEYNCY